jgi:hypothetical protein
MRMDALRRGQPSALFHLHRLRLRPLHNDLILRGRVFSPARHDGRRQVVVPSRRKQVVTLYRRRHRFPRLGRRRHVVHLTVSRDVPGVPVLRRPPAGVRVELPGQRQLVADQLVIEGGYQRAGQLRSGIVEGSPQAPGWSYPGRCGTRPTGCRAARTGCPGPCPRTPGAGSAACRQPDVRRRQQPGADRALVGHSTTATTQGV